MSLSTETITQIFRQRARVENHLLYIAAGKKPLPTREDCRLMALYLGTPEEAQSEIVAAFGESMK